MHDSEARFRSLYWPAPGAVVQDIRDHARACRLRADAGDEKWGRLAAFTADMTRRSLPQIDEMPEDPPAWMLVMNGRQRPGTTAAMHDLLHDLIMEGI